MTSFADNQDLINQGAASAIQSSAPPYVPFGSYTANDPYSGQPNSLSGISTEMQYNQIFNPYYQSPQEQLTYSPIVDNSNQTLGYTPIGQAYSPTAYANAYMVGNPTQTAATGYNPNFGIAQQGTVDPMSMVQNQFTDIMHNSDASGNGTPDFADTAVASSNARMNALGLGASTMAGNANTTAILNAAMPMAVANANTVAQLNSQNLSNRQQTMISNASWANAAAQFNAQNEQQNNQFFATLTSQIASQNADRATAISKFNAEASNSMNQFLTNLNSQRDEFNSQNQLLVDQSNVQWRRTINVANTAGINAANQANAQNMFNLSTLAQNNLWQQARDEASWALTSSENAKNRTLSLVNSALNRQTSLQILASTLNANMFSQLGSFATNLLGGSFGSSLFGTSNSDSGITTGSSVGDVAGSDFGGGGSDFGVFNTG